MTNHIKILNTLFILFLFGCGNEHPIDQKHDMEVNEENTDFENKINNEISFDLNSKNYADANALFVKKFKVTFAFAELIYQKNKSFFKKYLEELYNSNVAAYDDTFRGWNKIYNNVNDFKKNDSTIKNYLDKEVWTENECKEFLKLVDTYKFIKIK